MIGCSRISPRVSISMRAKQKIWTAAVQKRVAMTSSMLSSIKSLKIMGLSNDIQDNIQSQRIQEIESSKEFRWMVVLLNTIGWSHWPLSKPQPLFACSNNFWNSEHRPSIGTCGHLYCLCYSGQVTRLGAPIPKSGLHISRTANNGTRCNSHIVSLKLTLD